MWGMPTPPGGYLLCDGSSYDRTAYGPLFAILGTTYGAVDGSHFNVPDLRGRFPIGVSATHPIGTGATSRAGEEAHVLAWAELAAHYHNASQGTHTHGDSGHQHYCCGVDHTHYAGGVDHTHGIPAGQFSHQHYDNGHSHTYTQPLHSPVGTGGQTQGGGTYAYGAENTGVGYASITANSLPGGGTGAADRGLGFYTNPADRSLQFLTALNYANISTVSAGGISIDTQGSNQAHNNMPPFQTVNFVIKT
jgi:microcystin-dependent protein